MANSDAGRIVWTDLTVPDAARVRDFYQQVVGWRSLPLDMGGYDDYQMLAADSDTGITGICHARGVNADLPPQWLVYFAVDDVDGAAARAVELGGVVVAGPREMDGARFAVVRDPAGAVCALYRPAPAT